MKNFAVIGNPIGHSKSPAIFNFLFRHYAMDCNYTAICIDRADTFLDLMSKYEFSGANITSPFKEEVFRLLKHTDEVSKRIASVNVVIKRNDVLYGMNTDVYGVERSIVSNGIDVKNKKCIVLGAGGAARSAIYAVKELHGIPFVCNRTDSKAKKISNDLECGFIGYDDLKQNLSDTFLLILTVPEISVNLTDELKNTVLLNANYRSVSLKNYCRRYIDGYEWLIFQAVKTFEHFFDKQADSNEIKKDIMPHEMKNIAIIGPTGSGKSSYGKIIAEHYGMEFCDTDSMIEERTGKRIREIFSSIGEKSFRKLEEEIIAESVLKVNAVISIGSGALGSALTKRILNENSYVILLDIDSDLITSRLSDEEILKRPKLKDVDLKQAIDAMFSSRMRDYISTANLMIQILSNATEIEAEKIIRELDAREYLRK